MRIKIYVFVSAITAIACYSCDPALYLMLRNKSADTVIVRTNTPVEAQIIDDKDRQQVRNRRRLVDTLPTYVVRPNSRFELGILLISVGGGRKWPYDWLQVIRGSDTITCYGYDDVPKKLKAGSWRWRFWDIKNK
jgi:hypothetical protein